MGVSCRHAALEHLPPFAMWGLEGRAPSGAGCNPFFAGIGCEWAASFCAGLWLRPVSIAVSCHVAALQILCNTLAYFSWCAVCVFLCLQYTTIEYTLNRTVPYHAPTYLFVVDTCVAEDELHALKNQVTQVGRGLGAGESASSVRRESPTFERAHKQECCRRHL
jgi:hypothetical protein